MERTQVHPGHPGREPEGEGLGATSQSLLRFLGAGLLGCHLLSVLLRPWTRSRLSNYILPVNLPLQPQLDTVVIAFAFSNQLSECRLPTVLPGAVSQGGDTEQSRGLASRAPVPVPAAGSCDPLGTDGGGWGEEVLGTFLSACPVQLTKGQSKAAAVLSDRHLVWVSLGSSPPGSSLALRGACLSGVDLCHVS